MKRISIIIGLIIILLLPAVSLSCAAKSDIKAALGEEFTLPVGKTVEINGESLLIKFVEVTADSRCPNFAKCVTAGEARCNMLITLSGAASERVISILGGISSAAQDVFNQYTISFKLVPYPEIGKDIAPSEYQLVMTVTK